MSMQGTARSTTGRSGWHTALGLVALSGATGGVQVAEAAIAWPGLLASHLLDLSDAGHDEMWGFVFQGRACEGLTCNALEWIGGYGGGQSRQSHEHDGCTIFDQPLELT